MYYKKMCNFVQRVIPIALEYPRCSRYGVTICRRTNTTSVLTKPNLKREKVDVMKWFILVIPVGAFGLGVWQTQRLQWKLDLIKTMERKSQAEPVSMPKDFSELDKMEFEPVRVRGRFIHEREMLIGPRALIEPGTALPRTGSLVSDPRKNQGWHVITPFQLSDTGETILVNRGWVPTHLRNPERRPEGQVTGEVELTGVVRLTENRAAFMMKNKPNLGQWMYRDLHAMAEHAGTVPVWLDARGVLDPLPGWPIPNQTRVTLRNEHFSYLVTWFSLSAITSIMWHRYFVRGLQLL